LYRTRPAQVTPIIKFLVADEAAAPQSPKVIISSTLTTTSSYLKGETTQQIRWPEQEPKEAIEMEKHQSKMEKQDEDNQ